MSVYQQMTSRDRVLAALNFQTPDRIPIDLGGFQSGIHKKAYLDLLRHLDLEERISSLKDFAESCSFNRVEMADKELGVVTSGISYNYVKEALPDASVLKLGLVFPLPDKLIRDFASRCRRIIVVEELEPYLEEGLRYLGIEAEGKSLISRFGEIDTGTVRRAVTGVGEPAEARHEPLDSIPVRPPVMCIGCPHRGIFHLLSRKGIFVAGDIGCYTLAVSPPLSAIHTTVCMGAGVNQAAGIEAVLPEEHGKVVAVIVIYWHKYIQFSEAIP